MIEGFLQWKITGGQDGEVIPEELGGGSCFDSRKSSSNPHEGGESPRTCSLITAAPQHLLLATPLSFRGGPQRRGGKTCQRWIEETEMAVVDIHLMDSL